MKRRNIRLRPVRKAEIDLRRLAAAVAAIAAAAERQAEGKEEPRRAAGSGS